jgi:hypothetical protein
MDYWMVIMWGVGVAVFASYWRFRTRILSVVRRQIRSYYEAVSTVQGKRACGIK